MNATEQSPHNKQRLLGLNTAELKDVATRLGLPAFTGKQMADWLYRKHATSIDQMTNLSKNARARLAETYEVGAMPPIDEMRSKDGTVKYLFPTADGHFVETVYIPDADRATLCVSCQVGCKMYCAFCMTGRQGFVASLTAADILNQIYSLPERDTLTNIVFMGQGEPMDNLEAVLRATERLTADDGYGWSPKRITVSSVGLAKGLPRFVTESACHLAISLHHPLPAERANIMPAERAWSITDVVALLAQQDCWRKHPRNPQTPKQRRLSFEYILFDGVNDTLRHADALLNLLSELDCRINLIRFHDIPDSPLHGVDDKRMERFRDYLTAHGLFTTIRASRGQDIFAACGLLSTARQESQKTDQQ